MTSQSAPSDGMTVSQSGSDPGPRPVSSAGKVCVKCVLLGEPGVGKTSLFHALTNGHFSARASSLPVTLAPASLRREVRVSGGATLTVDLWDTAGQERFHSLTHTYYRGAKVVLLLYDLDSRLRLGDQFHDLRFHFKDTLDKVLVFLMATKADLDTQHALSDREVHALSRREGVEVAGHFTVSSLTGQHVEKAWLAMADKVWYKARQVPPPSAQHSSGTLKLHSEEIVVKERCAC